MHTPSRPGRIPPPPPFLGQKGRCKLCGSPVPKGRRTLCSEACGDILAYARSQGWAAWALARDHGAPEHSYRGSRCFSCLRTAKEAEEANNDRRFKALELDHIRPLWTLNEDERRELKWWLPFNLQLLCHWCHVEKTSREARDRYALQNPEGALARRMRVDQFGYDPLSPQMALVEAVA